MRYRLGLDLGTNSIGWSVLKIDSDNDDPGRFSFVDMGVRIFPDGREPAKSGRVGDSLAVQRRLARGARRNRDHGRNRKARLIEMLIDCGLFPTDLNARKKLALLNPYRLRTFFKIRETG